MVRNSILVGCLLLGAACGASSSPPVATAASESAAVGGGAVPAATQTGDGVFAESDFVAVSAAEAPAAQPSARLAQAASQRTATPVANPNAPTDNTSSRAATASDAIPSNTPLIIYTAEFHLAVFDVEASQRAVLKAAQTLEGFLARQDDTTVVIRVPSRHFRAAVGRIEQMGDVLHRNIRAEEVGEEFRDVSIRIQNAEAMRTRLEALLRNAANVEQALQVERELQRITELIERLKGRLRYLSDRIAFSTLTVIFKPREIEPIGVSDTVQLPFQWVYELGLRNLLNLR